jgi:hypothetical protein
VKALWVFISIVTPRDCSEKDTAIRVARAVFASWVISVVGSPANTLIFVTWMSVPLSGISASGRGTGTRFSAIAPRFTGFLWYFARST